MSMTVAITCNVSDRIKGFLASSMLELAPSVYTSPGMSSAVRDRIWDVLEDWFVVEDDASIILIWADPQEPGGLSVRVLGLPRVELVEIDGYLVARRELPPE